LMTTQDTNKRSAWQTERHKLLRELGHRSDHCAWAVLMYLWMHQEVARPILCRKYGLSYERMQAAFFERRHLCDSLSQTGFLPRDFLQQERELEQTPPDWTVVCAAIAGGLFPNVAKIERNITGRAVGNSVSDRNRSMKYSVMQAQMEDSGPSNPRQAACYMHPNSLCFGVDSFQCPLAAFYTLQKTTKLYVYDATEASAWALLLFSGLAPVWTHVGRGRGKFDIGAFATFTCERGDFVQDLLTTSRRALQAILEQKLHDTSCDLSAAPELIAIVDLLRTHGLGFVPTSVLRPEWPCLELLIEESAPHMEQLRAERAEKEKAQQQPQEQ